MIAAGALMSIAVTGCASTPRMGQSLTTDRTTRADAPPTILARGELLAETKQLVRDGNVYVIPAYRALLETADSIMQVAPPSVMQKGKVPPSGDKHDFMSLAPYWWPDPSKKDGLPYIRRDGEMNPESRVDHDGLRFQQMENAVEVLSLAWYLTGGARYAKSAANYLRVWFIEPATRMNPNLRFAQAVLGVNEGRGIGIIDLRHVPQLLDAVRILDTSGDWKAADSRAFLEWCRQYLTWLRTSQNGREERAAENNHGTWYDSQAGALALFVGDTAFAREVIVTSTRARIAAQIRPDGSQPLELERTRPIHYSLFNLDPFTQLAEMSRHLGVDLWSYTAPGGADLFHALHFIAPFSDSSHKWQKPEVVPIVPDEIAVPLRRAANIITDTTIARALKRSSSLGGNAQRWRLYYSGVRVAAIADLDSLAGHALAFARTKLRISGTSLDPAAGYPRATSPDGSWEQRPFNQWTSGFFAGTLWYLFQLTRDPEWRRLAERWTTGLEPAAAITTTHDLGFIIFDSFGHGFALTGDPHYKEVVIEASRSLSTRFDPGVGAIKSWDTERLTDARRTWKYPVIVDNLMNLAMLFHAGKWSDPRWSEMAERHALTSARAHVRADGSTAHVALFDPVSGKLERTATWQGFSDSSAWSRGQAWAVHGLSAAYGHTKRVELLQSAERAADYFISHLPPDGVPFWDLVHPDIPNTERDASAAAIAASGLLDLSRYETGDRAKRYRRAAERIVASLASDHLTDRSTDAAILRHSVGNGPQKGEIDVGLVYADYFFVEALLRLRGIYWQ